MNAKLMTRGLSWREVVHVAASFAAQKLSRQPIRLLASSAPRARYSRARGDAKKSPQQSATSWSTIAAARTATSRLRSPLSGTRLLHACYGERGFATMLPV